LVQAVLSRKTCRPTWLQLVIPAEWFEKSTNMTAFTISRTGKLTGTPCHGNKTQKDSIQRAFSLYAVFFLLFQQYLLTVQRHFLSTVPVRYPQNPHPLHFSPVQILFPVLLHTAGSFPACVPYPAPKFPAYSHSAVLV
jgi:hypothetical protein